MCELLPSGLATVACQLFVCPAHAEHDSSRKVGSLAAWLSHAVVVLYTTAWANLSLVPRVAAGPAETQGSCHRWGSGEVGRGTGLS